MPTRTKDTPDASVWTEKGVAHYLCARCLHTDEVQAKDARNGGYRAAIDHLWRVHSIRRVWITEAQPNFERVTALAFDLAVQHQRHF